MDNPQYPVAVIDQSNGEICSQGSDFNSTCSLSTNNSFDPNGDEISYKWHSTELYIEKNGQKELIFSPHKDSLGTKHVEIKEDTEYDIYLQVLVSVLNKQKRSQQQVICKYYQGKQIKFVFS